MRQLAIGDFVRLQIGGEPMVVVRADALKANHWICSWVNRHGQVQTSSIHQTLLRYIGSSDPAQDRKVP